MKTKMENGDLYVFAKLESENLRQYTVMIVNCDSYVISTVLHEQEFDKWEYYDGISIVYMKYVVVENDA